MFRIRISLRGYLLATGYLAASLAIGKYLAFYFHLDTWGHFRWFAETLLYRVTGASLWSNCWW